MDERLTDLEIRYSHQEAALDDLTKQVIEQQKTIDSLSRQVRYLAERLGEMAPSGLAPASEETPPPHY